MSFCAGEGKKKRQKLGNNSKTRLPSYGLNESSNRNENVSRVGPLHKK